LPVAGRAGVIGNKRRPALRMGQRRRERHNQQKKLDEPAHLNNLKSS
jgi:hypothetical protein